MYYLFGNKGSVWAKKAHIARSNESTTLCGTPMLSTNWVRIEGIQEAGCPECLKKHAEQGGTKPVALPKY